MTFYFENLDQRTMALMEEEVNNDIQNNKLYISPRLNELGKQIYFQLLLKSIRTGNEDTLAIDLKINNCLNATEQRETKHGVKMVSVPITASETLAEGEFNRFYIRALCRRVIEDCEKLEIYRAKVVLNPRRESEMMIGKIIDAQKLLNDLRVNIGVDTILGLPPGPNSGLSVRTAIARGIVEYYEDEELKRTFVEYDRTLLVNDTRQREPKHQLGRGARKKRQKSYR